MTKKSAGILLYRIRHKKIEVFLVHPGGPLYTKRDEGVWTIPKGEFDDEEPADAARREFEEETGYKVEGDLIFLDTIKLKSGKVVYGYACEGDLDPAALKSNDFEMEWPPKSGKKKSYPEVDRGEWFSPEEAMEKINSGQVVFIELLLKKLR